MNWAGCLWGGACGGSLWVVGLAGEGDEGLYTEKKQISVVSERLTPYLIVVLRLRFGHGRLPLHSFYPCIGFEANALT